MLRVDLHHHMTMTVLGLTALTQVIIIAHSTFEAGAMKVTNTATITDDATVTALFATIFIDNHHDASRHLLGTVDLDHGVRL
jgi:hypothetical protein